MKRYIYFLIILSCFSCKENYEISLLPAPKELEVVKTTPIDKCPRELIMLDTLVMMTTLCDFHCFSIYNKFTHEFIISFLDRGQKEFDFDLPSLYSSVDYDIKKILCYDLNSLKNAEINVDSILHGANPYTQIKYSKKDKELFWNINLSYIDDNEIVGSNNGNTVGEGMFFIYDRKTKEKQWIDYAPKFEYEDKLTLPGAYSNVIAANQDKKTIVAAFRVIDMVCFYNFDGSLKKRICFSEPRQPKTMQNSPIVDMEQKMFFIHIFATSKYFYAMRYNMSPMDLYLKKIENPVIIKFDWDGNIIGSFTYNEKLGPFCVDETQNRIYTITEDESNAEFYRFMELQM
jgi:hypothetical protein